jgi:hypothetical protein
VVALKDPGMLKKFAYQNFKYANFESVCHEKVKANLDIMARALSRNETAWETIFRKPVTKTWTQVKVAIKINSMGKYNPSVSIVSKVCEVLNKLGIPFESITLYDGGRASGEACPLKYGPFRDSGMIPPVNIISRGETHEITVDGLGATFCPVVVWDADILVNIAVNKGHDRVNQFGGVSMSLKNHVGTINFTHPQDIKTLCSYHMHEAILGRPSQDVPPKQQLIILDSLWVGVPRSYLGTIEKPLQTLIMGVFPGAVDYLTTRKIRERVYPMNPININESIVNSYIENFGYTSEERKMLDDINPETDPQGRGLVEINL